MVSSYRDLLVWQSAMQLAEDANQVASRLPQDQRFGLAAQLQRSAVSLPSNIAEGHVCNSTREFLRFLSVAQGSLAEMETRLSLVERLRYVDGAELLRIFERAAEVGKMMNGLRAKLKDKLTLASDPSPWSLISGP